MCIHLFCIIGWDNNFIFTLFSIFSLVRCRCGRRHCSHRFHVEIGACAYAVCRHLIVKIIFRGVINETGYSSECKCWTACKILYRPLLIEYNSSLIYVFRSFTIYPILKVLFGCQWYGQKTMEENHLKLRMCSYWSTTIKKT